MSDTTTSLPFVLHADAADDDITTLLAADRDRLRALVTEHGAVLLRGFRVGGADGLERAVTALSGSPLAYTERSSPRTAVAGRVYTSTDHPETEEIFLHNECSYQVSWPMTLYFYCLDPPTDRGATPLADCRAVLAAIDPDVVEEFTRRRWLLVRNYHERFGLGWRQAFDTDDRDTVAAYCRDRDLVLHWRGADGLRTSAVRDAVHRHPASGADVWFNHITFFHHTTLPDDVREGMLALFGEDNLPTNTYYGDGGRIPDDVLDHLRACYAQVRTRFDWKREDVLVVDNMLTGHGRESFSGQRRILVAMAEPSTAAG